MLDRATRASLLIGAALIHANPATAQIAAPAPASVATAVSATDGQLGDIVVTAQRRSQKLQDIPIAVTALDAATLERQQITSTIDLSRSVPNLVAANNVLLGTSVTYFLRGTGSTESIATFDLPVGTYVDEVFIARQNANQIALSGIERVEVLRGPQGTLFGRNTTGGAVSIISKKPDATPAFEGEFGYGSYNRRIADAAVNSPITDNLMIRVSGFFAKDDGYLKNPPTGDHLNGEDSWGGRLAIRALLSDSLTWDGSAQYIDTENTHVGVPGVVKAGPAGPFTVYQISSTGDLLTGRYTARTCKPGGPVNTWASQNCLYDDVKSGLLVSNFGLVTGLGTLNAITGYSDIRQSFVADNFANTDQPILGGGFGPNYYLGNKGRHRQFSQELKLAGKTFGDSLEYVAGVYYLKENNTTDFVDTVDFHPSIPVVFGDRVMKNTTRSIAVYGQVDYHFTDNLSLQLGGRYTDEKKNFNLNGLFFGMPITSAMIAAAGVPLSQSVRKFTPRAALSYKFTPAVLGYVSYTEGFKSGGWNARAFTASELVPFAPEYVKSYELGFKSEFLQRRARINATLFRADYSNLQVPAIYPGTTDFVTVNAADARVQGLELETSFNVTRTLNVFGNLGLMDSKYSNLTANAVAAGLGPKLQRTPPVTLQLGASQSFHFGHDNLVVISGDGQYIDKFETGPANTLAGHIGPHATYNAQIAWTLPDARWTISAECKNCTENVYVVQELLGQLFTNDPRRLMLRARFKY